VRFERVREIVERAGAEGRISQKLIAECAEKIAVGTEKIWSVANLLGDKMATLGLVEYEDASPEVRAVYDDIMAVRKIDWINNFWKAIANDPATLKRTWEDIKQIMAPGALDPLTKELIYVAVSVSNQCDYCIASHTVSARNKGMTDEMFRELMAVVGMANETNRLSAGYQVEIDEQFRTGR
jgi:AhpD family alkylhydroperoxidase